MHRRLIVLLNIAVSVILAILSFRLETQWLYDSVSSIVVFCLLYLLAVKFSLKDSSLFLLTSAFMLHNLGTFGLYRYTWGVVGYDVLVHVVSSLIVAYVLCTLLLRYHTHLPLLFASVLAMTCLLGMFIELLEFSGYLLQDVGGIVFAGTDSFEGNNYTDSMKDLAMNISGALVGLVIFYVRRRPQNES